MNCVHAALLAALVIALGQAAAHAANTVAIEQPLVHWRMVSATAGAGPDALTRDDRQVIRDRATFRKVWKRLHSGAALVPTLPPVDFARESVVVVPLAVLAGGGRAVQEQFVDAGPSIRLTYIIELPGKDCEASIGTAAPVLVLRTRRIDKPVTYVEDRLVHDCQ